MSQDAEPVKLDLSIVIVTWNSAHVLGPCLDALEHNVADLTYEVIVVDNASTDTTVELLRERGFTLLPSPGRGEPPRLPAGARFITLLNEANLGFAAANNIGLSISRAPVTLFLNADTEVQPGSLEKMLAFLREHPEVVAVGPKLTNAAGVIQGGAAGHEPTPRTVLNYSLGLYALAPERFPAIWLARRQYRGVAPIPVDWVAGAALMVRTEVARAVGGWPEDYFLYVEDIAFCRRLRVQGRIMCLPEAHVIHHIGSSVHQRGRSGLAQNILGLDRDYRSRYARPTVVLLHALGALGFALRWGAALLSGAGAPKGHSAPARHLWRACTLTSLRCMLRK